MILRWKAKGFTHIYFGAIRIALTFHGIKSLHVVSETTILDTRCDKYQPTCLATIQSTLNAGTIFVTIFANFNMPLNDLTLPTALKVQVQIIRCSMTHDSHFIPSLLIVSKFIPLT